MRVLVIGGGIGGLTATMALRKAGHDAHVFEQMRELGEIGAGIVLGPNAVRVLAGYGLEEKLYKIGIVSGAGKSIHYKTGEVLQRTTGQGEELRRLYGYPSLMCHRAEAHDVVRSGVPDDCVTLSARCVGIEEKDGKVIAHFADGAMETGDVLIGADGAESVVRQYVLGPTTSVGPSKLAWRGLAPGEVGREIGLEGALNTRGEGKFFLAYYVASRRYVNWIGIMAHDEGFENVPRFEMKDKDAALVDYGDFAEPIPTLIKSTDQVSRWVLYDGVPLATWVRGHVTLLGDAAHPMLPFAAQGAGMAIEDGVMIARCLDARPDDIDGALATYFGMRYGRCSAVQTRATASSKVTLSRTFDFKSAPPQTPQDWVWNYDASKVPLNL